VLDVAMPDLDGFQTLKQLRRDDPATRVVFLTMHRDDELVAAAIKEGAHGYVLKSRAHLDLISAIEHALAGRLCVPSLTSLTTVPGSRHAVQFHANDSRFLDDVSQFVGATLRSGEQIVMVVSEATRIGVDQRLQARQMNVAMLSERGQYVAEDSALALSHMMIDGRPDRERLAEIVHGLDHLRLAFQKRPNGRLTIFGDMAVTLCRNGNFEAALEIERIWNELTHALPFFTVCSYPIDCFTQSDARTRLRNVCDEHNAVTF
jgi:DNA-binding NarL/FixJ family response regulator